MRKAILTFVLALATITATAYDDIDEFVCELKSGATVTLQLTEEPSVELKSGQFVISSTRATVFYNVEDVKRFRLNKNATGIEVMPQSGSAQGSGTAVWSGAGQLLVNGCEAGETVAVYTTDGRQVLCRHADADGTLTITTDALPTGVYIVKSQSVNLKFTKK